MNSEQIPSDDNLLQEIGEDFLHQTTIQTDTLIQPPLRFGQPVPQVRFKTIEGKLNLILPPEQELTDEDGITHITLTWNDLLEQLQQKITAQSESLKPNLLVYLQGGDRLLDVRQIQEISEILEIQKLILHSVSTSRRQTAIASVTAGLSVEQENKSLTLLNSQLNSRINSQLNSQLNSELITEENAIPQDDPLYVKMTVRSGVEIRHNGSIVIFGDVNAGGEVIATGDILIWGKLKGVAHAGVKGNSQAIVMALHLEATQVRIADFVARVDSPTTNFSPEIAHVSRKGTPNICITPAASFSAQR
jgi:septum site-determining protein MinC